LHHSLVENDKRISARLIYAALSITFIASALWPACLSALGTTAALTVRKPRTAVTLAPTVKPAKSQAISGEATTAGLPAKPPPVAPVIERIRNQDLPVPIINERLIRDVMVGKPPEAGPPSGTEAFAPEDAPAPAGTAADEEKPDNQASTPASSLAPDVMSSPSNLSTPPKSNDSEPASQEKAKPGDAATDKQSTKIEDTSISAESKPTNPVDAPTNLDAPANIVVEEPPANSAKVETSAAPTQIPVSESAMAGVVNVGGEAFGAVEPIKDQAVDLTEKTTAIADALPLHGNLDSQAALVSQEPAPQVQPNAQANHPTMMASQEETLDSADSQATTKPPQADSAPVTNVLVSAPHKSIEIDSASNETETVMDSASASSGPSANNLKTTETKEEDRVALCLPGEKSSSDGPAAAKATSTGGAAHFGENVSLNLPPGSILGGVEKDEATTEDGVIVVDNDEAVETKQTIAYQELPTDLGKTRVLVGAKFPIVMSSEVTSKTAKRGDVIEARLKYDLKIGDRVIAKKGSVVYGHLNYTLRARSTMHSLLSLDRWYRNSGCLGVAFDEIVNFEGAHFPLVAAPAQVARIVKNKGEGRVLGVNHAGQITGPWAQQLRYKAIRVGLNAAMAPAGVFSFGAMPVALGVIGAANPSFAFMKPVGLNVRHRRLKGFAWGFLSGIPGSFLIEDTVIKGQEAVIRPGDEFLAEFRQEFTGEPITDASLMAGASTKVHGQVVPGKEQTKPASKAPKSKAGQKSAPSGKTN
jgi:hypothetical protein